MFNVKLKKQIRKNLGISISFLLTILILTSNFLLIQIPQITPKDTKNPILDKEINENIENSNIPNEEKIKQNIANMKGFFTNNQGQLENDEIFFTSSGSDKTFGFCESSVLIRLSKKIKDNLTESSIVKLTFENSNKVIPKGIEELNHKSNYFIGNDSTKWKRHVPNYEKIVYENLYDGIDLVYYFNKNGLKYDWVIKPYVDSNKIVERFEGIDSLNIDSEGTLIIDTNAGLLKEEKPYSYQKTLGDIFGIDVSFKLIGEERITYEIGDYEMSNELVIDPLIYSTYVGGSDIELSRDIVLDSNNNAYITGYTRSSDFPTTPGCFNNFHNGNGVNGGDIFVFKLNSNGSSLLYSTFIGGSDGDRSESIALDYENNIYIAGDTWSLDFPTTPDCFDNSYNGFGDVVVIKLNHNGSSLLYSTFVGGSDLDWESSVAIDSNNNTYILGQTWSADFPITPSCYDDSLNGTSDIFVFKLNSNGSNLTYSTFIGGSESDMGSAIALDSENNTYITGNKQSSDFPTTFSCYDDSHNENIDVFVLKLSSNGSNLTYSTFIGGGDRDYGCDIVLDSEKNAYITGYTYSSDFPTTSGCYDNSYNGGDEDVIVLKLNSDGSELLYSTFVGGSKYDHGFSIALDSKNNTYITGSTDSSDFLTTYGCYNDSGNGVFVFKLNSDGTDILYSTYVGEWGTGEGIALDSDNNAYVTGYTKSSDFPTTVGCYNDSYNGGTYDVFVFKIDIKNYPQLKNISFSKTSCYRTTSIKIYINVSDIEDNESDLLSLMQYRAPFGDWKDLDETYIIDHWATTFIPDKNAKVGFYDLRIKIIDQDGGWSKWLEYSDAFEIFNFIPIAEIDEIKPNPAYEGQKVWFYGNGTDDGTIEGYNWLSNIDGFLSREKSFNLSNLSIGTHTIAFKVKDNNNSWSKDVILNSILKVLKDSDGDLVTDIYDKFPNDPSASIDSDNDGYPDEWNEGKSQNYSTTGLQLDTFSNDPNEWKDSDKDGIGDNSDAFTNDPNEWKDSDKDGIGDNSDAFPNDPNEQKDSDGDGVGDNSDAFTNDPNESKDSDGDGVGDNSDAFTNDPNEQKDSDGDGVGDNSDFLVNFNNNYFYIIIFLLFLLVSIPSWINFNRKRKAKISIEWMKIAFKEVDSFDLNYDNNLFQEAISSFKRRKYKQAFKQAKEAENYITPILFGIIAIKNAEKSLNKAKEYGIIGLEENFQKAVNAFQNEAFDDAKNYANVSNKEIEDIIKLREESKYKISDAENLFKEAKKIIFIDELKPKLDKAKTSFEKNEFGDSLSISENFIKEINSTKKEAKPEISLVLPENLDSGIWNRTKLTVTNSGRTHAKNLKISLSGRFENDEIPKIPLVKAGESQIVEFGLLSKAPGKIPFNMNISYSRVFDDKKYQINEKQWLEVEVNEHKKEERVQSDFLKTMGDISIERETENFRGFIRLKAAAINKSNAVITDVSLKIIHDSKVLRFDRIEPDYITHGQEIYLGNINRKEKKTVAVYLDPIMCTSSFIDATATFKDLKGEIQMVKMDRKKVNVVCPIFFTTESANPAMLKNLVRNVLTHNDSKVYTIPQGFTPQRSFELCKEVCCGRDIRFVRELSQPQPYLAEAWFYGTTKINKNQLVIRVSVRKETNSIELFVASSIQAALTGLLAELGHDLSEKLKGKGMKVQQITNITIKDSIIQRSSLLFRKEGESEIKIENSIIQRSNIKNELKEKKI